MLILALTARWLLALVLIAGAVAKVGRRAELREAIIRYELVPVRMVAGAARLLVPAELLLGLLLASGLLVRPVGIVVACLLATFAAAISWNLVQGRRFQCGCGLGSAGEISWPHVGRNVVMIGLAFVVAVEPAVLAVGQAHVAGAPGVNDLVAVPLGVVLMSAASRLISPLRGSVLTPSSQSDAGISFRSSSTEV